MTQKFSTRLDANESIFFLRELDFIKSKSYDVLYPEFKIANGNIIPISREANIGAETITYYQYDQAGMAKLIANYADDLPRVDVTGKPFTSTIKGVGASFGYNIQEIRASMMADKRLQERRANAARRAVDQKLESLAAFGDSDSNLRGFINHPNISEYVLPADGTGASTKFKNKTPDQVLRDLNGMVSQMLKTTKGIESPDTLLLPIDVYTDLTTRARSANSDTTILEFFLKNSAHITNVDWVNQLTGAADNTVDDVCMIYRKDPDKLTLEIPVQFEQFPPQPEGLEFVIDVHARIGGVIVYYPLSISKSQGV